MGKGIDTRLIGLGAILGGAWIYTGAFGQTYSMLGLVAVAGGILAFIIGD